MPWPWEPPSMPSIIAEHNPQTSSPLDCSERNRSHLHPPGVGSCKNRGTRRPCNDGYASIASCLLERLFSLLGPAAFIARATFRFLPTFAGGPQPSFTLRRL